MKYFFWKLKREILRIKEQLSGLVGEFYEPFSQRKYDSARPKNLLLIDGLMKRTDKVAIVLLYQPNGVLDSSLWTCEHLISKGYSPLVISNAPISESDCERLKPKCWRIVVRPNFGYDFGGYRDGIWLLRKWEIQPINLIILNDSIWFPIYPDEKLIEEMESNASDFIGALQLDPKKKNFNRNRKSRPFFGSFFLMVKKNAFVHPSFIKFWETYKITSNKYKTIRRGERQLSHTIFDANIPSSAIHFPQKVNDYLTHLSAEELILEIKDFISVHSNLNQKLLDCRAAYEPTHEWKIKALEVANLVIAKQNCLTTAPVIAIRRFNVPYLKKSSQFDNLSSLKIIENSIKNGFLPELKPCIRDEIKKMTQTLT